MPADFELDMVERTVRSRVWGVVTDGDLRNDVERIRTLFEQGILDSTWAQVADFSAVERCGHISSEEIRRLAGYNPWPKGSLRALVLPSDVGFGLGRMYQVLCGTKGENVCVVRSKSGCTCVVKSPESFGPASPTRQRGRLVARGGLALPLQTAFAVPALLPPRLTTTEGEEQLNCLR